MSEQFNLFNSEELNISVNGVAAVNSVDVYDIVYPNMHDRNNPVQLKNYVQKGEYTIHSSGAYHAFKNIHKFRDNIPKYFSQPVFPWIQSIHTKKMMVPGVPQGKEPYPYVGLGRGELSTKKIKMHVLVCSAFNERPNDNQHTLVSHKNDIKWDYRPKNLFWNTPKNNSVGPRHDRKLNILDVYDKCMQEFSHGRDYNVEEYEDDEGFYL